MSNYIIWVFFNDNIVHIMIKLFTMVKDEVDIVEDWILYHGNLFGFDNLYIVDNMSTDGTYEVILNYIKKGVKLSRHPNYLEKGNIMKQMITNNKSIIAFPLDIDEFIVYYDKHNNRISTDSILPYLHNLIRSNNKNGMIMNMHTSGLYKCDYIHSKITNASKQGYKRAAIEATRGRYDHQRDKIMAKSFFDTRYWKGEIDHGNHCNYTSHFSMSNICLVHYHSRNYEQHKKKVINNASGLGYDANNLEALKSLDKNCAGAHHIGHMIRILEGKYSINTNERKEVSDIDLSPISNYLKNINISTSSILNVESKANQDKRLEYIKNRK